MDKVQFYRGPASEYNSETHQNSIYKETDTNNVHIFGSDIQLNIIDINNQTIDLNDLLTDTQTLQYKYTAAGSTNISNKPVQATTLLTVSQYGTYIKQEALLTLNTSDFRSLIYSRKYIDGAWTDWQISPQYTDLIQNAYSIPNEQIPVRLKATSLIQSNTDYDTNVDYTAGKIYFGNIFNASVGGGVNLHLTGAQNTTQYQIVSTNSVGYWFADNNLDGFFRNGRFLVDEDTNRSAYITAYNSDTKTITVNETLNPDEAWDDHTVGFYNFVSGGGQILGYGSVATGYSIATNECLSGTSSTNLALATGDRTAALGDASATFNWQTIAKNSYESAFGMSNRSHNGSIDDQKTLFSIGNGSQYRDTSDFKQRNAVELMRNGDFYLQGIGNYDGQNDNFAAKTLQEVITENTPTVKSVSGTKTIWVGSQNEYYASGTKDENTLYFITEEST